MSLSSIHVTTTFHAHSTAVYRLVLSLFTFALRPSRQTHPSSIRANRIHDMLIQTCIAIGAFLSLGHAKPTTKVLQHDDVIVAGSDGSIVVLKDYEYGLKEARETLQRRKAKNSHATAQQESHTNHRRCDESVEYQVLSVSGHFNNIATPFTIRDGHVFRFFC